MTIWTHRTIIVPDVVVEQARQACAALAGSGGSGMYTVPLSPTGAFPATHWASTGLIDEEFAHLLGNPDALAALATNSGLDPAPLVAIVAASDITDEPADVALARLGLQICHDAGPPT